MSMSLILWAIVLGVVLSLLADMPFTIVATIVIGLWYGPTYGLIVIASRIIVILTAMLITGDFEIKRGK